MPWVLSHLDMRKVLSRVISRVFPLTAILDWVKLDLAEAFLSPAGTIAESHVFVA